MGSKALSGVRILDMTHVQAGPTSSQLLAWMGADVIKFENPTGDITRKQLRHDPEKDSLYFTMLNSNKRSIISNMKSKAGCKVFEELLKNATSSWKTLDRAFWKDSDIPGKKSMKSTHPSSTPPSKASVHPVHTVTTKPTNRSPRQWVVPCHNRFP